MLNLYITSEPESKIKQIFCNLKNFYILDVDKFVENLQLDMTKQTSVYLANAEIEKELIAQSKLKKNQGIIYITNNLCSKVIESMKSRFRNCPDIGKFVLIDNGTFPLHTDISTIFDEILFYERFKRNKIIDCNGFIKNKETDKIQALMDELSNK